MVGRGMQVRDRVMGDADVSRRHAALERVTREHDLPGPPRSPGTRPNAAEVQEPKQILADFHGAFSTGPLSESSNRRVSNGEGSAACMGFLRDRSGGRLSPRTSRRWVSVGPDLFRQASR
jgi:hypothetical protein